MFCKNQEQKHGQFKVTKQITAQSVVPKSAIKSTVHVNGIFAKLSKQARL
jgi:hypothetical protein